MTGIGTFQHRECLYFGAIQGVYGSTTFQRNRLTRSCIALCVVGAGGFFLLPTNDSRQFLLLETNPFLLLK